MMYGLVAVGLVLLVLGAEVMVRGAVALARRLGISPMVIGMTVVAFGTSAPEMVVSLNAALTGADAVALGNVVGSNIANVLLILGAAGLLRPILAKPGEYLPDGAVMIAGSAIFAGYCWKGVIGPWQGATLLLIFIAAMAYSYHREMKNAMVAKERIAEVEDLSGLPRTWLTIGLFTLGGLGGVILGADWLVKGGVELAREFGVPEEVIGLTLVAVGTSLPELAATVVAALRGHAEVAVGNVIGSNMFNVLAIIGTVAVVTPLRVPAQLRDFDLFVMLGAAMLLLPFLVRGRMFGRRQGSGFLLLYAAYIAAQVHGADKVLDLLR